MTAHNYNKQFFHVLLVIAALIINLSQTIAVAANPRAQLTNNLSSDRYTFQDLGVNDQILEGPYDSFRLRFRLPNTWRLLPEASIQLNIKNVYPAWEETLDSENSPIFGARLDIYFNDQVVDSILVDWIGEGIITIPIPQAAIDASDDRQTLFIYMDASIDCEYEHKTSIIVYSDSSLDLKHEFVPPKLDLTTIPAPFYREDVLVPKNLGDGSDVINTHLVTPNRPSAGELQAALTISSALGLLTNGRLELGIINEQNLSTEIKSSSNLIFVGFWESFTELKAVDFPAQYENNKFNIHGLQDDDGIMQIAISPWNLGAVILNISGQNDKGIIKASQALSSGIIMVNERPDLAVVSEVTKSQYSPYVAENRTLAELGYENTQLSSSLSNPVGYLDVEFLIPVGQSLSGPAYIEFHYANSPLLNYAQSGFVVYLNGTIIGGILYDEESGDEIDTKQITIPDHLLIPGINRISIQSNNQPWDYCSKPATDNMWLVIYNQTLLHIPLSTTEIALFQKPILNKYYDTFTQSPTLDKTGFILAPNSPNAFEAASKIAYELGSRMIGNLVELKAVYASDVTEAFKQDHNIIIIGKAAEIPLILELADFLPAPFEEGSNTADESVFQVIYRYPEGVSLGYLELLEAPWDPSLIIIAVLGSTDQGISFASDAMVVPSLRNNLTGNYAVVRNEQVISVDTRLGIGTGNLSGNLVPDITPEVIITESAAEPEIPFAYQEWWLMPAVVISVLLATIVIIITLKKKK